MFCGPYNKELFKDFSETISEELKQSKCNFTKSTTIEHNANLSSYFNNIILTSKFPAFQLLQFISYALDLTVIGGSICEKQGTKLFNTCFVFEDGNLIGQHWKVHLFDICIPGKFEFKESEVLTAGNQITIIKSKFATFGIGICYDIWFCDYAMALR